LETSFDMSKNELSLCHFLPPPKNGNGHLAKMTVLIIIKTTSTIIF
jgi:hypothetical protein